MGSNPTLPAIIKRGEEMIIVTVHTPKGVCDVYVDPTDEVDVLMEKAIDQMAINTDDFIEIAYEGEVVDGQKLVCDLRLEDWSEVHLIATGSAV